ncbi:MAG: hypothetical protein ABSF52_18980 [Syntrophobacteraceae bacterium]|jgi:hypothetical protein
MTEIGLILGYTKCRISQIHKKAIIKLKAMLAKKLRPDDLPGIQFPRRTPGAKPGRMQPLQVAKMN